jgi:uncharacterized RDD family membrane protein YckC
MTEQQLSHYEAVDGSSEPAEVWRNEVQDRLARYKRRRGRRIEGAYTMRFPFPADEVMDAAVPAPEMAPAEECPAAQAEPADLGELVAAVQPDEPVVILAFGSEEVVPNSLPEINELVLQAPPAAEEEDVVFVDPIPRPRPKRKVIAFPRHATIPPEVVHRLADPVTPEVPRILDVPEELEAIPATPFLDGLQLDLPDPAAVAASREHVELPAQAVRVPQRILAGIVDLAVTGVATGVFAAVAYKALENPALSKPLVLGLLAGALVLWSTYQYLFVVYAGKTLGMIVARTRLRTFKGRALTMRQRRYRVFGLYLSALSLGMGLMWALVDVDGLCWHDRLSRTFLAARD